MSTPAPSSSSSSGKIVVIYLLESDKTAVTQYMARNPPNVVLVKARLSWYLALDGTSYFGQMSNQMIGELNAIQGPIDTIIWIGHGVNRGGGLSGSDTTPIMKMNKILDKNLPSYLDLGSIVNMLMMLKPSLMHFIVCEFGKSDVTRKKSNSQFASKDPMLEIALELKDLHYGKKIRLIGSITATNKPPQQYWADQAYGERAVELHPNGQLYAGSPSSKVLNPITVSSK